MSGDTPNAQFASWNPQIRRTKQQNYLFIYCVPLRYDEGRAGKNGSDGNTGDKEQVHLIPQADHNTDLTLKCPFK